MFETLTAAVDQIGALLLAIRFPAAVLRAAGLNTADRFEYGLTFDGFIAVISYIRELSQYAS